MGTIALPLIVTGTVQVRADPALLPRTLSANDQLVKSNEDNPDVQGFPCVGEYKKSVAIAELDVASTPKHPNNNCIRLVM
jgi:hypothetical protein